MNKKLLVMLLTFSSTVSAYTVIVNPNERGVYVLNDKTGLVKKCESVAFQEQMVTACTSWSGEFILTPNPRQQEILNQILNQ